MQLAHHVICKKRKRNFHDRSWMVGNSAIRPSDGSKELPLPFVQQSLLFVQSILQLVVQPSPRHSRVHEPCIESGTGLGAPSVPGHLSVVEDVHKCRFTPPLNFPSDVLDGRKLGSFCTVQCEDPSLAFRVLLLRFTKDLRPSPRRHYIQRSSRKMHFDMCSYNCLCV